MVAEPSFTVGAPENAETTCLLTTSVAQRARAQEVVLHKCKNGITVNETTCFFGILRQAVRTMQPRLFSCLSLLVAGINRCIPLCLTKKHNWCTPVIVALERLKQKNLKFKLILSYIVTLRPTWAT